MGIDATYFSLHHYLKPYEMCMGDGMRGADYAIEVEDFESRVLLERVLAENANMIDHFVSMCHYG